MADDTGKVRRKRAPEASAPRSAPQPVVVVSDAGPPAPTSKYPSLDSSNKGKGPSAPPADTSMATITSPEWIEQRAAQQGTPERKKREPRRDKSEVDKVRSSEKPKSSEKSREGGRSEDRSGEKPKKTKKEAPQVKRDRLAGEAREAREGNTTGAPPSRKAAEAAHARAKAAHARGVADSGAKTTKYPTRVEWESKNMGMSKVSCLGLAGLLALLGLMIYTNLAVDVSMPPIAADTDSAEIPVDLQPTAANDTQPVLIQQLLSLPYKPVFSCGSDDHSATVAAAAYSYSSEPAASEITFQNQVPNFGSDCNYAYNRIGYCVTDWTCSRIGYEFDNKDLSADAHGSCTAPVGPRRNGYVFITSSFVEILNDNPAVAVGPAAVALGVAFVWVGLSIGKPQLAATILPVAAIVGLLVVFIGSAVAPVDGGSLNFWILIYAAGMALATCFFWKNLHKIGRVLNIGALVLSGDSIDGVDRADSYKKSWLVVAAPAFLIVVLQGLAGLALLFLAAAVPFVTEYYAVPYTNSIFFWADRWADYASGVASKLSWGMVPVPTPGGATVPTGMLSCEFDDLTSMNSAVIVFAVFFFFASIYYQSAVKFLVNCATADWYFHGTKKYRPPPKGLTNVGMAGLKRAMWCSGWKVLYQGIWSTLASGAGSITAGFQPFITHLIVSPIDCLVYSFFGLLMAGFVHYKSRFALVHASMYSGTLPRMELSEKASCLLVRRTYGRRFAAVGDSPESRLLILAGSWFSTACGLATWVWVDYIQNFDSATYLGVITLGLLWVVGSAVQKPGLIVMVAVLVDSQDAFAYLNLEQQMAKNAVLGFVIVSEICNTMMRIAIEIPASSVDATVYCFAIEETKRRKIRCPKLNELIHSDYLNDSAVVPPNHTLERVVVRCPENTAAGKKLTVEVEGRNYQVTIPGGAKPGRDFEVAVAVPINRMDYDSSSDSGSEEDSGGVVRAAGSPSATQVTQRMQSPIGTQQLPEVVGQAQRVARVPDDAVTQRIPAKSATDTLIVPSATGTQRIPPTQRLPSAPPGIQDTLVQESRR